MITTNFNKSAGDFDISWPEKVSRHDLVYKAPPTDPMQYGMPLGNGDIGALLWCDDRKIYIAFNKCDLWDDGPEGVFTAGGHEENTTTLRHGCRIIIDFGSPIFDSFYLKDFEARLHLKNGCAELKLNCPFGSLSAKFFICYNSSILCGEIETDFKEAGDIQIALERYGSRAYSRWYVLVKRDETIGLNGTDTHTDGESLFITQALSTGEFVCALKPLGDDFSCKCQNSHIVSAIGSSNKKIGFFATITSPLDSPNDKASALSAIKAAEDKGFDKLLSENEECWKAFWDKSFVETDDDYLDNLWHLVMYYSCAGQRGKYPGRFINSLWNWNRDVQPWLNYFHWNQQETYWGLNAAGHHELCESYLDFRFNAMGIAKDAAKSLYDVDNALFVSDIVNRLGYSTNGQHEKDNHTPVCEIALDFWRQYLYTCDLEFLKKKALPYMIGASRFIASCFVKEEDGKYHAKGGTPYEGNEIFYDVITELTMLRALLTATIEALRLADETVEDVAHWEDMLQNVAELPIIPADERFLKDNGDGTYTLLLGKFKGKVVDSPNILAVGKYMGNWRCEEEGPVDYNKLVGKYVPHLMPNDKKEDLVQINGINTIQDSLHKNPIPSNVQSDITRLFEGHPQASVAAVYPMSILGLKDKDSELYRAAVTTAMTMADNNWIDNTGWHPMPLVLARLGRTEEVDEYIENFPSVWQYYNNGFGHYGPSGVFVADAHMPFRITPAFDADTNETFYIEPFRFRHMGLEPLAVFAATMNERLLQSYDGTIRIAPAYGKKTAKFKLHAVGGFEVMVQIENGDIQFVAIKSLFGNTLKLQNPFEKAYLDEKCFGDEVITLDTEKNKTYVFTPSPDTEFNFEQEVPKQNCNAKIRPDLRATLGTLRSF